MTPVHPGELLAAMYDWHNAHLLRRQTEDVAFWLRAFGSGQTVAVLGAGTGRVAIPLGQAGIEITAVDRDLARLRRIPGDATRVVCACFERLPFRGHFDHIVFPYSSLQLFPTADLVGPLRDTASLLKNGSRIWVDVSDNFAKRTERDWSVVLEAYCADIGDTVIEFERGTLHSDHFQIDLRYVVGAVIVAQTTERWYFHSDSDLRLAFAEASLLVRKVLHGYGSPNTTHRRIYELSKIDDRIQS